MTLNSPAGKTSKVGDTGLEPVRVSSRNSDNSESRGIKSGNSSGPFGPGSPTQPRDGPDLAALVSAWPMLPGQARHGILALVRAFLGPEA